MVGKLYSDNDGVIRAVGLRASKLYIERLIQYLCPLELHCDVEKQQSSVNTKHQRLMKMQKNTDHDIQQQQ